MDKLIINAWDKNQAKVKEWIKEESRERKKINYINLLKNTIRIIFEYDNINEDEDDYDDIPDYKKIVTVDHGEYQGTLLYIIPNNTSCPYISDYWYTFVMYGSCSHCDTLDSAIDIKNIDERVKALWTICLHMIQNMNKIK